MAAAEPRRKLSPEERAKRDQKYMVEYPQFTEHLKGIVASVSALEALSAELARAGKGMFLVFSNPETGEQLEFKRSHLRTGFSQLKKEIMSIKHYMRVAKKKPRKTPNPASLAGVYTPVFCGPALIAFFSSPAPSSNFGPLSPQVEADGTVVAGADGALIDQLTMAKQGYLLRNALTMLFYRYARANGLVDKVNGQKADSDEFMNAVFDSQDPALAAAFYTYAVPGQVKSKKIVLRNPENKKIGHQMIPVPKTVKVAMDVAVAQGLVEKPLSTYDVLRRLHPGTFAPEAGPIPTYFYQSIASLNYYSKDALERAGRAGEVETMLRDDVRQAMLGEHQLIHDNGLAWAAILEPGKKEKREQKKQQKAEEKAKAAAAK